MVKLTLYVVLLLFVIVLEATHVQAPLTLTVLIALTIQEKRGWIMLLGFFSGIILDSISFRLLGESSLFFVVALGLLFLYGKKFEIEHIGFSAFFIAISSIIYGFVFGFQQPFLSALIGVIGGICLLLLLQVSKHSIKNRPIEL